MLIIFAGNYSLQAWLPKAFKLEDRVSHFFSFFVSRLDSDLARHNSPKFPRREKRSFTNLHDFLEMRGTVYEDGWEK